MSPTITAIAEGNGYTVVESASLKGRNTFRVSAKAELLIDVRRATALTEVFAFPSVRKAPVFILGEGSNVLFTRDWQGVVLSVSARGIVVLEERDDSALVRAEAGENWNDFVHWSLGRGFAGLENLVLIPGSVGAAPIQNIGAYGVEVREFVETVEAFDREVGVLVRLGNTECGFGYRDSLFKRTPGRYVITAVEFVLPRGRTPRVDYVGIADELAAMSIDAPTPSAVAEAVARLRVRKLPDPAQIGNTGSFFKNPLVPAMQAEALRQEHMSLPVWPTDSGLAKLSAAWLIEAQGFKGHREGDAGVSEHHALVLVNHGRASGAEILTLAERIRSSTVRRFGVALEPEPIIL